MYNKANYGAINGIDNKKVDEIVESILANGWKGAPILTHESIGLITGSHRAKALEKIADMYDNDELTEEQMEVADEVSLNEEYALDVTEIVNEWLENNPNENFEFDSLGVIFKGTEIEKWKNEIPEW